MPALPNRRYEQFALELAKGLGLQGRYPSSASAAYTRAGGTGNKASAKVGASRLLRAAPAIIARVQEIQGEVAQKAKTTLEQVIERLDLASSLAEQIQQPAGITAAEVAKSKLLGLEPPTKTEIGKAGDFSTARSTQDMARAELAGLGVVDPSEDLVLQAVEVMSKYAASFEALVQGKATDTLLTDDNQSSTMRRH